MGDVLPPVALSCPGLSQPIGYQSSSFLSKKAALPCFGTGTQWPRPNPAAGARDEDTGALARWHGREIGDTTLEQKVGGLAQSVPPSVFMEAPSPTFTTCTAHKPREEVESHQSVFTQEGNGGG